MENEENLEQKPTKNDEESAILKEYKKLQESTVSKEKYEKDIQELKEKNEIYLKAITEGSSVPMDNTNEGSLEDMISDINKFKGTNLQYWQKMTPAIDKMLKEMPEDDIIDICGNDGLERIIKVNEAMKELVDKADKSSDYFRVLYDQKVKDSAPKISSEINNAGSLANYLVGKSNKK